MLNHVHLSCCSILSCSTSVSDEGRATSSNPGCAQYVTAAPLLLYLLQATPLFHLLLRQALALVRECPCPYEKGCPACVQHLDCKNYNAVRVVPSLLLPCQLLF
jgi:hypothetical protein